MPQSETIRTLTAQFIADIQAAAHELAVGSVRDAILGAIEAPTAKRDPNAGRYRGTFVGKRPRRLITIRKALPIQYCPVPGCQNRGAPVFGMVCGEHRGVAKSKIRKYREARRLAKARGK